MDRPVVDGDDIITCFRDGEVTLRKNRREDGFTMADQEIGYQHISKGDLVVHGMDGFAGSIGISDSDGKATPVLIVMNPIHDTCVRYFMYQLRVYAQLEVFLATSSGIRVRSCALNWKKLGSLPAMVPPLDEQQRIAAYLDERCAAIDETRQTLIDEIDALRRLRKATIHKAVTKGLDDEVPMRDSGVEWIGEIPIGWELRRGKYLLRERKEKSATGLEEPLSMSQKMGLVPTALLGDIPNRASSFVGAKLVEPGDLVFNKLKAHLGVFSVSEYYGLVSPDYAVYEALPVAKVKYLDYLFKTPRCIGEFIKRATGVAQGLTRLYTSQLFDINYPYPRIAEQQRIADYLDERCAAIDSIIETRTKQLERLDDYRKALIFAYVTGKKEVPVTHV